MRVMDLTRGGSEAEAEVELSVAVDFLISLLAHGSTESKGTFEVAPGFADDVSRASAQLLAALERFGRSGGPLWGNLVGLAQRDPAAVDVPALIRRVGETEARELWLTLAGEHVPPIASALGRDVLGDAADGDAEAARSIAESDLFIDPEERQALALLALSPDEAKAAVLEVFDRWHKEVYAKREAATRGVLTRDARAKRGRASTCTVEQLVEAATNGLELKTEPWVRRVVLVPHVSMRPWNVMCGYDDTFFICYPAADESFDADASAPPPRLVRLHRALGDEKRLRMLKRLAGGSAGLQELADAAGLAKSSAHHHLVILRGAGLVKVTTEEQGRYTLRRETLPEASEWLQAFLAEEVP